MRMYSLILVEILTENCVIVKILWNCDTKVTKCWKVDFPFPDRFKSYFAEKINFPENKFGDKKIIPTFAIPKQTRRTWRGGRVVDCGGLENRWSERIRGFESLPLRWKEPEDENLPVFLCLFPTGASSLANGRANTKKRCAPSTPVHFCKGPSGEERGNGGATIPNCTKTSPATSSRDHRACPT